MRVQNLAGGPLMAKPLSMTFWILLALFYPSWIHPQSKTPELVRIGYSGIGIAHDLLKIMGNTASSKNTD